MMLLCEHCGEPLIDGGIDWYCKTVSCNQKTIRSVLKRLIEEEERKQYERLKAKYEQS